MDKREARMGRPVSETEGEDVRSNSAFGEDAESSALCSGESSDSLLTTTGLEEEKDGGESVKSVDDIVGEECVLLFSALLGSTEFDWPINDG